MRKPLNFRQRKFIEAYAGNATDAARKAGYSGNENTLNQTAHDLLMNPKIKAAIEAREKKEIKALIATREQRQIFWTEVMKSAREEMISRLRASELLGKSEADFTEKVSVNIKGNLFEGLQKARKRAVQAK